MRRGPQTVRPKPSKRRRQPFAALVDALTRLDEHLLPRATRLLSRVRSPQLLQRVSERLNDYMASPPWRNRFEQKLYLGLVVGSFLLLWTPLVVIDALTTHTTDPSAGSAGVDRVTDGALFIASVAIAAIGVAVSRRWRRRP